MNEIRGLGTLIFTTLLVLVFLFGVYRMKISKQDVDLNPRIAPHQIYGEWRRDSETLILKGAGEYIYEKSGVEHHRGKWKVQDFNITLSELGYRRVVVVYGVLQIVEKRGSDIQLGEPYLLRHETET